MYLKKYFFDIAVSVDAVDIDLGNVVLSHYRVAKMRQQDLVLRENTAEYKLEPGEGLGTAKPKDRQDENADSKGKYFNANIRKIYAFVKL